MFNSNIVGRWMAVILALVGLFYLVFPLVTRGPVGHISPQQRAGQPSSASAPVSSPAVPAVAAAVAPASPGPATGFTPAESAGNSPPLDPPPTP